MVDHNAIQKFLIEKNLHFFIFYTKADKPIKVVIRHLPGSASAEDITAALQEIDYVFSVKRITTKRPTPEGGVTHLLPPVLSYGSGELESSRNLHIDHTM
jgi:hypothetical protein